MSAATVDLSTRRIKIYASAYDATARAEIADHLADINNPHGVTKAQVGLGLVDNTSDAGKPISTGQAAALALKAPLASPALTGTPTAPTAVLGTVTDQVATTQFVQAAINAVDIPDLTGDLADHLADTANPHGVTKAQVGLGLVDNTADLAKPVSNPTQTAINAQAAATGEVAADLADHLADTANPHGVTKTQLELGAVDNTADLDKPVSAPQQLAINAAVAGTEAVALDLADHLADVANPHGVTKSQVGLGAVDNTSDAAKPVSTATQTALNLKAPLASPALTGIPSAPTAAPGTATTQLATTAFATAAATSLQPAITAAAAAAAAAQDDATAALGAASAAGSAAAAAQADATQAVISGTSPRPGEAPALFGQTKVGPPDAAVPVDPAWVATSTAGSVLRIDAATAADPQTVAPVSPVAVETGRLYEVRWRVQRQTDPADPLNDSVTLGIRWLTSNKSGVAGVAGTTIVDNLPLVVADGIVERSVVLAGSANPLATVVAPPGAVYFRPFVDTFGDSHVTDLIVLETIDATRGASGSAPFYLPLLDADPAAAPGAGLFALYAIRNPDTSATLRMQVGTDPVPVDIVVNVGFGG